MNRYTIPFKETEVKNREIIGGINLIKKHEKCLQVLRAIDQFKKRKQSVIENVNGFAGTFPHLRRKYINRIDTINLCINRLHRLYNREADKI